MPRREEAPFIRQLPQAVDEERLRSAQLRLITRQLAALSLGLATALAGVLLGSDAGGSVVDRIAPVIGLTVAPIASIAAVVVTALFLRSRSAEQSASREEPSGELAAPELAAIYERVAATYAAALDSSRVRPTERSVGR